MDAQQRASKIRLIAFDVDGVMTDGSLHFTDDGRELKTFNTLDGHGLKALMDVGVHVAIITGRKSGCVVARAANLGIHEFHQGVENKLDVLNKIRLQHGLSWEACAFMGDDLIDLPCMLSCGFSCAPSNAYTLIKSKANWIAPKIGGQGAVREACDFILSAQGLLDKSLARYLVPHPDSGTASVL
ncbi:MAG: hypothetical protein RIR18_368 [Pseudomonadota bacterium]|jgi:3-deoxy-D-manno-octulosonate 8-phosphate phosphatase (KDO 8-P phosphatase)